MLGNDRSTDVIVSVFKNFYSENQKSFREGEIFDENQKNRIAKSPKICYNIWKQQLSKGIKTKPRKAWS